ncbi:MAG: hypothetical protein AAF830_05700 [Pseudomonadota bacterium]
MSVALSLAAISIGESNAQRPAGLPQSRPQLEMRCDDGFYPMVCRGPLEVTLTTQGQGSSANGMPMFADPRISASLTFDRGTAGQFGEGQCRFVDRNVPKTEPDKVLFTDIRATSRNRFIDNNFSPTTAMRREGVEPYTWSLASSCGMQPGCQMTMCVKNTGRAFSADMTQINVKPSRN